MVDYPLVSLDVVLHWGQIVALSLTIALGVGVILYIGIVLRHTRGDTTPR